MTPETIHKLEEAFSWGATDLEAYAYADISSSLFYEYLQNNPDFLERKKKLKQMPKMHARRNVAKAIESGGVDESKWYLERKIKGEFSTRNEHTGEDGEAIVFSWLNDKKDNNTLPTEDVGGETS